MIKMRIGCFLVLLLLCCSFSHGGTSEDVAELLDTLDEIATREDVATTEQETSSDEGTTADEVDNRDTQETTTEDDTFETNDMEAQDTPDTQETTTEDDTFETNDMEVQDTSDTQETTTEDDTFETSDMEAQDTDNTDKDAIDTLEDLGTLEDATQEHEATSALEDLGTLEDATQDAENEATAVFEDLGTLQNAPPQVAECSSYKYLDEANRAMIYNQNSPRICDSGLKPDWYRFRGAAGTQMPTSCVPMNHCGTSAPGWLNASHPSVAAGQVSAKVCFHWSSGCCQWSRYIRVRNCSGFYVYQFNGTPACTLRYCGNGGIVPTHSTPKPTPPSECSSYKYLDEVSRAMIYNQNSPRVCDSSLSGWYRFRGAAGTQMPTSCVPMNHCGTSAPGWLNTSHPSVAAGQVSAKVCFHWSSGCCQWSRYIRVRNCSGFYVYQFNGTPACTLRYCGNGGIVPTHSTPKPTPPSECSSYKYLDEASRAMIYNQNSPRVCDSSLSGWYRFGGAAGTQMPTSCVPMNHCGTSAPGWLNASHPSVAAGQVSAKVCFHWSSGCCQWSRYIRVRNCSGFYVYQFKGTPACTLRYCGNGGIVPTHSTPTPTYSVNPCSSYKTLNEADRSQWYRGRITCDSSLATAWYRFTGSAGNRMPDSCVPTSRCGTHAPGWLQGRHPSYFEGVVSRTVCFHWTSNCCRWKSSVSVRNCSGFYVYKLQKPPACSLRYCGVGINVSTPTPLPTTTPTPTTPGNPCSSYKTLNEADRSQWYKGRVTCDSSLATAWYRFAGSAGSRMPDSCVPSYHCGTHAPGWLQGRHPSYFEGVVSRTVCFHWTSNCCRWNSSVSVRNCGGFYVYKLQKPPACSLRYCGVGNNVSTPSTPRPTTTPTPTAPGNPCSNYTTLYTADRSQSYSYQSVPGGKAVCDSSLATAWYRFAGSAGSRMPDSCVPTYRCGTHAPGWLQGRHPSYFEGVVSRTVCFHWTSNCCNWKTSVSVRNCGGFYVYKLQKPPSCRLRYCGVGNNVSTPSTPRPTTTPTPTAPGNPCSNYTTLFTADRSQSYSYQSVPGGKAVCDSSLATAWYRFAGSAGSQMPDSCVPTHRCGTHAPGWLQGRHPSYFEGVVSRTVCFHWGSNCCNWKTSVSVRNCGGFYVYKLQRPPTCTLRYCGVGSNVSTPSTPRPTTTPTPTAPGNPCSNYTTLYTADRSQSYSYQSVPGGKAVCDSSLATAWYRFAGSAGSQMPDSCVPTHRCGTHAPGWLQGKHPSYFEGVVSRTVCFHWSNNCCRWKSSVSVRNCGGFYVYKLQRPPACTLRYCGVGNNVSTPSTPRPTTTPTPTAPGNPCSNYTTLYTADRSQSYSYQSVPGGKAVCDSSLATAWYRFAGSAGSQMPDSCVPTHRCGTHAPGWLQGKHPSYFEGVVSRTVCFHWSNNCCRWKSSVSVRNCGGFYVYKLQRPPACTLRYCGVGNNVSTPSTPRPTTTPTPTAPGNPCSNYTTLFTADRSQSYSYQSVPGGKAVCDSSLATAWYRFAGSAGSRMPDTCVPTHRCGTHAPGWLQGKHPSYFEGVVSRTVCFHWSNNCCRWKSSVSVRNCGGFYVYKLQRPPACTLRYCGVGNNVSTPTPTPTPTPTSRPSPTRPNHGFMILCLPDAMHVNIPRDSLPTSFDPSLLHLSDSSCGVVQMDETNVKLTTPLDSCGTTRRTLGEQESFHNKVLADPAGLLGDGALFNFPFRCVYKKFSLPGQKDKREPLRKSAHVMDSTFDDEEEEEELEA